MFQCVMTGLSMYRHRHGFGFTSGHAVEVNNLSDAGFSRFCFSGRKSTESRSIVGVMAVLSL